MTNEIIEDRYLGDGVYASFDGYHVNLDLRAQPPSLPITMIALDPSVRAALLLYINDLHDKLGAIQGANNGN